MKPDFICIGAIKSGTTWLHYNLQKHPEIWLPPIKELRYFNEPEYNLAGRLFGKDKKRYEYWRMQGRVFLQNKRGLLRPGRVRWYLNYFFLPRSPQWYSSLFAPGKDRISGDITPLYAPMPESNIEAIKTHFPEIKIIYLLRNPIDRMWSHILLRCISLVDWQPENLTEEIVRKTVFNRDLKDEWLWSNGRYMETINKWEKYFPSEQMFIGFYDDLKREPTAFLRKIYQFLGTKDTEFTQPELVQTRFNQKPIALSIPTDIEKIFAEYYQSEITSLAERFGGVTTDWLNRVHQVIESPSPRS